MTEPETFSGRGLAAFLRGLLPETTQFDKQIRHIEEEAVAAVPGRTMTDFDEAWAAIEKAIAVVSRRESWADAGWQISVRSGRWDASGTFIAKVTHTDFYEGEQLASYEWTAITPVDALTGLLSRIEPDPRLVGQLG
jgi:hypothetical protein